MRNSLRFIGLLVSIITGVVLAFTILQVRHERRMMLEDMDRRAMLLAEALGDPVAAGTDAGASRSLIRLVEKYSNRPPFVGVAIFDPAGRILAISKSLSGDLSEPPVEVKQAMDTGDSRHNLVRLGNRTLYLYAAVVEGDHGRLASLAIFQNAAPIRAHVATLWKHGFVRLLIHSLIIALATLLVIRWYVRGPIARFTDWF